MKLKFKSEVEVNPLEWVGIAIFMVVIVLLVTGKTDEAIQMLKHWLELVKK